MMHAGESEAAKGGIHATIAGLAATCAMYNGIAWIKRREPHLAVNAVLYALLWGFETYQTHHHWSQRKTEAKESS